MFLRNSVDNTVSLNLSFEVMEFFWVFVLFDDHWYLITIPLNLEIGFIIAVLYLNFILMVKQ